MPHTDYRYPSFDSILRALYTLRPSYQSGYTDITSVPNNVLRPNLEYRSLHCSHIPTFNPTKTRTYWFNPVYHTSGICFRIRITEKKQRQRKVEIIKRERGGNSTCKTITEGSIKKYLLSLVPVVKSKRYYFIFFQIQPIVSADMIIQTSTAGIL